MLELIDGKACIADILSPETCNQLIATAEKCVGWQKCEFGKFDKPDQVIEDISDAAEIIVFDDVPILRTILGEAAIRILDIACYLSGELITQIYDDSRFIRSSLGDIAPQHLDSDEKTFTYRKMTALVYLNDKRHGLEGGGTNFEWLDTQYEPKQGRVIVFYSNQYHGAVPVTAGTKYLLDLFMGNKLRNGDDHSNPEIRHRK